MRVYARKKTNSPALARSATRSPPVSTPPASRWRSLGADGRIERVNAGFAALLAEDARVVAGRDLASLFRDEDAMRLKAFFAPGKSDAAEETVFAVKARRAGVARTKLSLRPLGPGRFVARALAEPAPPC